MVGKCKNSSKFAFAWEWEGRNQGSKFSHLLSIYLWGLVPGLTDCNELFVTEKTAQRYFHFVWFSLVHKPSSSESLFEIVRKAKKLFRFKQTVLPWGKLPNHHWWCKGQKILCQERAKGCSNASSSSWSSRQEERLGVFCLLWVAVPGAQSMSLVGQGSFSRVKQSSSGKCVLMSLQHFYWTYLSTPTSGHFILRTIFYSFCNTVVPFIQFGALVGKTQEMDVPELLTLKGALDAILLKLGSVQCQHSFTRVFCPMHET